jgi:hypothetical protein
MKFHFFCPPFYNLLAMGSNKGSNKERFELLKVLVNTEVYRHASPIWSEQAVLYVSYHIYLGGHTNQGSLKHVQVPEAYEREVCEG